MQLPHIRHVTNSHPGQILIMLTHLSSSCNTLLDSWRSAEITWQRKGSEMTVTDSLHPYFHNAVVSNIYVRTNRIMCPSLWLCTFPALLGCVLWANMKPDSQTADHFTQLGQSLTFFFSSLSVEHSGFCFMSLSGWTNEIWHKHMHPVNVMPLGVQRMSCDLFDSNRSTEAWMPQYIDTSM